MLIICFKTYLPRSVSATPLNPSDAADDIDKLLSNDTESLVDGFREISDSSDMELLTQAFFCCRWDGSPGKAELSARFSRDSDSPRFARELIGIRVGVTRAGGFLKKFPGKERCGACVCGGGATFTGVTG